MVKKKKHTIGFSGKGDFKPHARLINVLLSQKTREGGGKDRGRGKIKLKRWLSNGKEAIRKRAKL